MVAQTKPKLESAMPAHDTEVAVQFEELRGRIKGVERDQKGHEDICSLRYAEIGRQQVELKVSMDEQGKRLADEIRGIRNSLGKVLGLALAAWLGLTAWSLKSQWQMQQDTNKALIQMTASVRPQSAQLPYLPDGVPQPSATPSPAIR